MGRHGYGNANEHVVDLCGVENQVIGAIMFPYGDRDINKNLLALSKQAR